MDNTGTVRRSGDLFDSDFRCAESVLIALAERNKINSHIIPKIASGLCSGFARTGGPCGAVVGAIMGINLYTGRNAPGENTEKNYKAVQNLIEEFTVRNGSINCTDLTGCDLSTEQGQKNFKERNLREKCRGFVEEATEIALFVLETDGQNRVT